MTHSEQQSILNLAMATGELLLTSGAETYRVEETIDRMCQSRGVINESFVTPSVILVTGLIDNIPYTNMKRVQPQPIDLHKIDEANSFARSFTSQAMPLSEAWEELERVSHSRQYPLAISLLGGGLSVAGFAVLFGAPWFQFPIGFVIGALLQLFMVTIMPLRLNFFLRNIVASFVVTILIHLLSRLFPVAINPMIIGAIMPLVPGVAITNSVRDTLTGDFLSGLTRASEAIFIALGIAFGVGVGLVLMTGVLPL